MFHFMRNFLPVFALLLLLSLLFSQCRKKTSNIALSQLYGTWVRNEAGNFQYGGMKVVVQSDFAVIDTGTLGSFQLGQRKWKNISPIRDSVFAYEELGSDGLYYPSQFRVRFDSILRIFPLVGFEGDGQLQIWEKQ